MPYSFTEAAVGIITAILVAAALAALMTIVSRFEAYDGYTVYADFASVEGVKLDDPVQIAGVTIGRVESIRLHQGDARLRLRIKEGVKLHADAAASVANRSLFTEAKFIHIEPGSSKDSLRENQRIVNTSPAHNVTDLMVGLIDGRLGAKL